MRRILLRLVLAVVAIEAVACAALYVVLSRPPDTIGAVLGKLPMPLMFLAPFETLWKHARGGRLQPGDPAPEFRLPTLDHKSSVALSSFRGSRPVVLVFGSYT